MRGLETCILALDTSSEAVIVGASGGADVRYASALEPAAGERPRHASALLAEVERAVEVAGGWARIGRIGIGIGPGSYTGLRIGIATGRALAQARELPAVPVGSLTALALGIAERSADPDRPCLAVADARRGELFAQLHDGSGRPLTDPAVLDPQRLSGWLAAEAGNSLAAAVLAPLAAGSGSLRFVRELEAAGVEVLPGGDSAHRVSARHLCRLAATEDGSSPDRIRPVYLREPDAKRWLDRDRNQAAGL